MFQKAVGLRGCAAAASPRRAPGRPAERSRRVGPARALGSKEDSATNNAKAKNETLVNVLDIIREAERKKMPPDYYDLLGLAPGVVDPKEIKQAYRQRARKCHPDLAGEEGHEACIVLNEAYATLMDDDLRELYAIEKEELDFYDDGNEFAEALKREPYTGEPLSKTVPLGHFANKMEKDDPKVQADQIRKAVFVDENTCIGCMQCVNLSPATFRLDEEHGRARVFGQWLNDEDDIQCAIDSCPVDCIHWVPKEQLGPLEYTQQKVMQQRLGVALMMSGQGGSIADVFEKTQAFLKFLTQREEKRELILRERKRKEARAKAREEMRRKNAAMWDEGKSSFWNRAAGGKKD